MSAPMSRWERFTSRFQRLGNDGLTSSERKAYARRWREGQGKAPTREERVAIRVALGSVSADFERPPRRELDLTMDPQYFDELVRRSDGPSVLDPVTVELLRRTKGQVKHR